MASSACSPIEPLKTEVKASRERLVPDTFTGYHEVHSLAQVLDLADAKVLDTHARKHFVTRKCIGKPHPFESLFSLCFYMFAVQETNTKPRRNNGTHRTSLTLYRFRSITHKKASAERCTCKLQLWKHVAVPSANTPPPRHCGG